MASPTEPLDLVDIAVLLNYERVTTDSEFANTKVREVAFPGEIPRSVRFDMKDVTKGWNNNRRTWIVLDKVKAEEKRQSPATMKMEPNVLPSTLSDQQLETIFHRIRAFDSCASVTTLLVDFFNLFPRDTKLRVRHAPKDKEPGVSYITSVVHRRIIQEKLVNPKFSTAIITWNNNNMKWTGTESEMWHWYMEFYSPDNQGITSVLDMASMQFGEVGRGPGEKGKMLIVLETKAEYEERLGRIADGVDPAQRETGPPIMLTMYDPEVDRIVRKVKERWEKRETEKWCAHCGAPEPKFKCGVCEKVWFCNRDHQKMVWSFHKGYCQKG